MSLKISADAPYLVLGLLLGVCYSLATLVTLGNSMTMRRCRLPTLLSVLLVSGCSVLTRNPSPLCHEIASFANATDAGQKHMVALTTDWGVKVVEGGYRWGEKKCESDGYAPGKKLCDFLMDNTSREFSNNNFSAALACLGKRAYTPKTYQSIQWTLAKVDTDSMPGVNESIVVSLDFDRGTTEKLPTLIIGAEKHK